MAPSNTTPFALCSVLEKDKLNGTNYMDWIRNLRIVLRADKKEDVSDTPLPEELIDDALLPLRMLTRKHMQFETNHEAYDMIVALRDMFQTQARTERFNVSKAFVESKLAEGAAVGPHVIKMVGYVQRLEKSGFPWAKSWPPISFFRLFRLAMGTSSRTTICMGWRRLTPPGTPQRNGVSERRNRTLLDMVRSMMSQSDLPLSFWGYALETTTFTLNKVPSKSVVKTPYEMWTGKTPSLSFLKIWGCEVFVKRLQSDKITPKSDKCIFVGYPKETLGYYFYNRSEGKVFVTRNGVFLEKEFLKGEKNGKPVRLEEVWDEPIGQESMSDASIVEQVEIPTAREVPPQPQRMTKELFLIYGGDEELVVTSYTDASFQSDKDDSKSQSGFVFTINGGAISWKSSKQETVADSLIV
ncbi:unnamed protein product [Miscanthus lutarioriparius]|uniref:Integrase catalytic domain-containing protein n=1 Tax=Miscanthus lutarioriparius TaxID=422564 RepID=A0A811NHU4_9POAL|nr:unnamed protein product [Miscanthus lutarioriparius]